MTELRVGSWVRVGGQDHKVGKVQALCQGGLRAIVRLHHGCPVSNPNTWQGEEMVDSSLCDVICRPEWDSD